MAFLRTGTVGLTGIGAAPAAPGPYAAFDGEMLHSHAAAYALNPGDEGGCSL